MKIFPVLLKSAVLLLPGLIFMIFYNLRMEAERFQPHIYTVPGSRVLVARIQGDPDLTMDDAGTLMFNLSRKLKLSPGYMSARHLRWNQRDTISRQNWVVDYAKIVPETATGLPDLKMTDKLSVFYERREETEIAEILHLGRYEEIPDSLARLRRFVREEGYKLDGFYEEVYLVFEAIEPNPGEYETLLRYQVAKKQGPVM